MAGLGPLERPHLNVLSYVFVPLPTQASPDVSSPYILASFILMLDTLMADYSSGRSLSEDKAAIYQAVSSKVSSYGLDGPGCLQRFICELQHHPLKDFTVLGKIITTLFTLSADESAKSLDRYHMAQQVGMEGDHGGVCKDAFAYECPFSVFNYFTSWDNHITENL